MLASDRTDPHGDCPGASSCSAGILTTQVCDGRGGCRGNTTPCEFACASTTECRTSCSEDAHCLPGNVCTSGKCVPAGSTHCSPDRSAAIDGAGTSTSCGAYLCDPSTRICAQLCGSDNDCAPGNVCGSNRTCSGTVAGITETGCGCAVPAPSDGNATRVGAISALLIAMALGRRRRSGLFVR
jgi:MYXO-CTERM domain-containing protein